MSKAVCMICLRSNVIRTEDIDDILLAFYEELIYFDMYIHEDLKVCPVCEHQLRKFYNFRQNCRRGLILLKNWSNDQQTSLQDLCTKLPPSPVGVCTKSALQKFYVYGYSDPNSITKTVEQSDTSITKCLFLLKSIDNPLKPQNKSNSELKAYSEDFMEYHEQDENAITYPSNNDDDDTKNVDKNKYTEVKKLEIKKLNTELKSVESTKPNKFLKRKETREKEIHDKQIKLSKELKYMLVNRLENGEFHDIEDLGVTMNKDVFLKIFDKFPLNSMAIQGVFKKNVDNSKLRQFLHSLLRRFNPQYETLFELECLDTHEKRVAEFNSRRHSKEFLEADHRCEICYKVFELKSKMLCHRKWHNRDLKNNVECNICSMRFPKRNMKDHVAANHWFLYRCKLCPYRTYNMNHMKIHYDFHKGVMYSCPVCQKNFSSKSMMDNHRRQGHLTDHHCPFCARSLVSELGLRQHLLLKHGDESPELVSSRPGVQCTRCEAAFHNRRALLRHVARHHEDKRQVPVHRCFFCKERFETLEELQAHKAETDHCGKQQRGAVKEDQPYVTCPVCDQQIPNSSKNALLVHHRDAHPGMAYVLACQTRNYLCEHCGRAFKSRGVYYDHLNIHSGAKPYECSECGARFASRRQAVLHVERHGPPRHACNICQKMFSSAKSLYLHMRIHIGDRRFKCSICSKGFLHKANLRYHIDRVHNNIKRIRTRKGNPKLKKLQDEVAIIKSEELIFNDDLFYSMDVINEEIVDSNIEM